MVQAVVNNFLPLLFIQMQGEFGISLSRITLLITVNFLIQLLIDLTSAPVIAVIGYRAAMSLLHSFYCWGHVGVVLLSTVFFRFAGISHWRLLALLWCLVPAVDFILFLFVPLVSLESTTEEAGASFRSLAAQPFFWLMMLMMVCSGASEQAVSQWASALPDLRSVSSGQAPSALPQPASETAGH